MRLEILKSKFSNEILLPVRQFIHQRYHISLLWKTNPCGLWPCGFSFSMPHEGKGKKTWTWKRHVKKRKSEKSQNFGKEMAYKHSALHILILSANFKHPFQYYLISLGWYIGLEQLYQKNSLIYFIVVQQEFGPKSQAHSKLEGGDMAMGLLTC